MKKKAVSLFVLGIMILQLLSGHIDFLKPVEASETETTETSEEFEVAQSVATTENVAVTESSESAGPLVSTEVKQEQSVKVPVAEDGVAFANQIGPILVKEAGMQAQVGADGGYREVVAGDEIPQGSLVKFQITFDVTDTDYIQPGKAYLVALPDAYFNFIKGKSFELQAEDGRVVGSYEIVTKNGQSFLAIAFNEDARDHYASLVNGKIEIGGRAEKQKEPGPGLEIGGVPLPEVSIAEKPHWSYPNINEEDFYGDLYKYGYEGDYDHELIFEIQMNTDNYVQHLLQQPWDQTAAELYKEGIWSSQKAPIMIFDDLHPDLTIPTSRSDQENVLPVTAHFELYEINDAGAVSTTVTELFPYRLTRYAKDGPVTAGQTFAEYTALIQGAAAGTWGIFKDRNRNGQEFDRFVMNAGYQMGVVAQGEPAPQQYLQFTDYAGGTITLADAKAQLRELDDAGQPYYTEAEIARYEDYLDYLQQVHYGQVDEQQQLAAPNLSLKIATVKKASAPLPDPNNPIPYENTVRVTTDGRQEEANTVDPEYLAWGESTIEGTRKLVITKLDADHGRALAGVEFTLTHQGSGTSKQAVTDADGQAVFKDLENGIHLLTETGSLPGYEQGIFYQYQPGSNQLVALAKGLSITINEQHQKALHYHLYNRQTPVAVAVEKRWADDGQTGLQHPAVTFRLQAKVAGLWLDHKDPETDQVVELTLTEANDFRGRFTELPSYDRQGQLISYRVKEMQVPQGYVADAPISQEIEAGDSQVLQITNRRLPTRDVIFTKENHGGETLAGATFTLYQLVDGKAQKLETITTLADGQLHFVGLTAGDYRLVEEEAPDGYQEGPPVTFTIDEQLKLTKLSGATDQQVILNELTEITFRFQKVDEQQEPLAGAEFQLIPLKPDGSEDTPMDLTVRGGDRFSI